MLNLFGRYPPNNVPPAPAGTIIAPTSIADWPEVRPN